MNEFPTVQPPPDGLASALGEARRRRQRSATLLAGSGLTAVALLWANVGGAGTDTLLPEPRPEVPADGAATPLPTATPAPAVALGPAPTSLPSARPLDPTPLPTVAPRTAATPRATTAARPPARAASSTAMVREDGIVTVPGSCSYFGDSNGYCTTTSERTTEGVLELGGGLCSGGTGSGELHYATRREVDMAVTQGGRTVWRWSTSHPDSPGAHTSPLPTGQCSLWKTRWSGVGDDGRAVAPGDYVLVVTYAADEAAGVPPAQHPFTIG